MRDSRKKHVRSAGFTLIELSVVLVIIGLIIGGVLVGQDLIRAAQIRAAISQIEKFNTATNTFFVKYGYLPGDMPDPVASGMGFQPRGPYAGQGDGDGILEGNANNVTADNAPYVFEAGETVMFWEDLSTAGLIPGTFTAASSTVPAGTVTASSNPNISAFFPQSQLGSGIYVYVSGSMNLVGGISVRQNGFGLAGISQIGNVSGCGGCLTTSAILTVSEAYSIDKKIDDGKPQRGNVIAESLTPFPNFVNTALTDSPTTCQNFLDSYSMTQNNGSGMNCALTFIMQGAAR